LLKLAGTAGLLKTLGFLIEIALAEAMKNLIKQLNYRFKNSSLLKLALTHRSYNDPNNERLEFLGDAVLNFCIAEKLFQEYPHYREGDLSRLRANLVNGEVLADLAKNLDLNKSLKMGAGELHSGGLERKSTLADTIEAIIGAIYLDGGIEACQQQITVWYADIFANIILRGVQKDPKTQLQEYVQAKKIPLPVYTLISIREYTDKPVFQVSCHIPTLSHMAKGKGSSRKRAEQAAAKGLLVLLGISE